MAFTVEFVSPEDSLYSGEATQVVARTRGGGEIAFLTGHEPFIGSLITCEVRVTESTGTVRRFAVRGGFVSVSGTMSDSKVTVLSDAAVPAEEIDASAVEAELAEARAFLADNPESPYARDDVRWAEVRQAAVGGGTADGH